MNLPTVGVVGKPGISRTWRLAQAVSVVGAVTVVALLALSPEPLARSFQPLHDRFAHAYLDCLVEENCDLMVLVELPEEPRPSIPILCAPAAWDGTP